MLSWAIKATSVQYAILAKFIFEVKIMMLLLIMTQSNRDEANP